MADFKMIILLLFYLNYIENYIGEYKLIGK